MWPAAIPRPKLTAVGLKSACQCGAPVVAADPHSTMHRRCQALPVPGPDLLPSHRDMTGIRDPVFSISVSLTGLAFQSSNVTFLSPFLPNDFRLPPSSRDMLHRPF